MSALNVPVKVPISKIVDRAAGRACQYGPENKDDQYINIWNPLGGEPKRP